jgi:TPR repeat protein
VTQDYAQAQAWFEKAAAQNDPRAQYELGVMYAKGKGVTQDYAQAQAWFEKAAAQGDVRARYELGIILRGMKE